MLRVNEENERRRESDSPSHRRMSFDITRQRTLIYGIIVNRIGAFESLVAGLLHGQHKVSFHGATGMVPDKAPAMAVDQVLLTRCVAMASHRMYSSPELVRYHVVHRVVCEKEKKARDSRSDVHDDEARAQDSMEQPQH